MKKVLITAVALLLLAGCATTDPLRVRVTPMGEEPSVTLASIPYALPRTVLKVEITYEELRNIPGPYGEFAERYLGIGEVIRKPATSWHIRQVHVSGHAEPDPAHYYSVNVLEGTMDQHLLGEYQEKGVILDGSGLVHVAAGGIALQEEAENSYTRYEDLGIYSNFEERTETMYKTLVTDTSFVRVPVERTVVEQKSPALKAEEAAEFILELRTRRFELLTGEYEVYPDGEAMSAAIEKLDRLEAAYLTLFTGKTLTRILKREYFLVPDAGHAPTSYRLGLYSDRLGFVPAELMEGEPLEVYIRPFDIPAEMELPAEGPGENGKLNRFYYRWPGVVQLQVRLGEKVLSEQRISLYQSGRMVMGPIR